MGATLISCDQYDLIEIACTYRYLIRLVMKSGTVIEGVAMDTALNENRVECIKLSSADGETLVVLKDISLLEACVENPHFQSVTFS